MKVGFVFALFALISAVARAAEVKLTLLHINDMHARVLGMSSTGGCSDSSDAAHECDGGWSRLFTAAKQFVDNSNHPVIFVDNGDQFMGTVWSSFYRGQETAVFMNKFCDPVEGPGFAACIGGIGNHEWDFGYMPLLEYVEALEHTTIVSSNIQDTCSANENGAHSAGQLGGKIEESTVITLPNGNSTTVAFVGYTTPATKQISSPPDCVNFIDEVDAVNAALGGVTADIIIATGHSGVERDIEVADAVSSLQVIVGGHSHTFMWNTTTMGSVPGQSRGRYDDNGNPSGVRTDSPGNSYPTLDSDGTPIVQAFFGSRYLGAIELTFDTDGYNLIEYNADTKLVGDIESIFAGATTVDNQVPNTDSTYQFAEDAGMKALVDELKGPLDEFQNTRLGYNLYELSTDVDGTRVVRSQETPLANFVADAMYYYMNTQTGLSVDIAFQNAGGIRAPIPEGDVTFGNAIEVHPFANVLTVLNISGEALYVACEHSLTGRVGDSDTSGVGRFLAVSTGFKLEYDPNRTEYQRVTRLSLNDITIPNSTESYYTLVTNSFMGLSGGDGYSILTEQEVILESGDPQEDALAFYLENQCPSCQEIEGRIVPSSNPPNEVGTPLTIDQSLFGFACPETKPDCPVVDGVVQFTILHINDMHARVQGIRSGGGCSTSQNQAGECDGGWARLFTAARQFVDNSLSPVIFIDNGDQFMGTVWSSFYQGQETHTFLNKFCASREEGGVGFAACIGGIGNHEFDFGYEKLVEYLRELNYHVVSSNIEDNCAANSQGDHEGSELGSIVQSSITLEIDGVNIGILGYTTATTKFTSSPPECVSFLTEEDAVQSEIENFLQENVSIILATGHAGLSRDVQIANAKPDIDLIVGGHSHTFLWNVSSMGPVPAESNADVDENGTVTELDFDSPSGDYPALDGDATPIVHASFGSKYLGAIKVTFNISSGDLISYEPQTVLVGSNTSLAAGATEIVDGVANKNPLMAFEEDEEMKALVDSLLPPLEAFQNDVIGFNQIVLDTSVDGQRRIRSQETPLGNFVADAMYHYMNTESNLNVDISWQNGGGIRAPIPAGNVTFGNAIDVHPFANVLSVLNVSGANVWEAATIGLGNRIGDPGADGSVGRFPAVSAGLNINYDPAANLSSRVLGITLWGEPIPNDNSKYYSLVTNSFIAAGGDAYEVFGTAEKLLESGDPQEDALANFLEFTCPTCYEIESRITPISNPPDEDGNPIVDYDQSFEECPEETQACPLDPVDDDDDDDAPAASITASIPLISLGVLTSILLM